MDTLDLPDELIAAFKDGASALRSESAHLAKSEHMTKQDSVGRIIRKAVATKLLQADSIEGWLKRHEQEKKDDEQVRR